MENSSTELNFQSISNDELIDIEGEIGKSNKTAPTLDLDEEGLHTFTKFPDSAVDVEDESDTAELINKKQHPVWSFAYYQDLFDVDTMTVIGRIKGSMIPLPSANFNRTYIKGKPDMYGPFWICATLVLCIGICGNLTTLFNNWSNPDYVYKPQFERLPIAAIIIYSYTFILPLLIKLFFWWKNTANVLISHIICTYGYSLFIFIPASILFIVPYDIFDWIVVAVAICLSGSVILISIWPLLENDSKKLGIILLVVLFTLHVAMAVGLRLYFFQTIYVNNNLVSTTNVVTSTISVTTKLISNSSSH